VTVSDRKVGGTVTYTCHNGYRLFGPAVRYCSIRGIWTDSTPSCKSMLTHFDCMHGSFLCISIRFLTTSQPLLVRYAHKSYSHSQYFCTEWKRFAKIFKLHYICHQEIVASPQQSTMG